MKKYSNLLCGLAVFVLLVAASETESLGGRGGMHAGGGRMGGGGGARPAMSRTPAVSRPQMSRPQMSRPQVSRPQVSRPQTRPTPRPAVQRPAGGGNLGGGNRPNLGGNLPGGNRPQIPSRPPSGGNAANRLPPGSRPNVGGAHRPSTGNLANRPATRPNTRPSTKDLNQFLNIPGGTRPSTRPGTRPGFASNDRPATLPSRPGFSGGAAADFFNNRPSTRPAPLPDGPSTRPARPGPGNRPGGPGEGIVDRPGRPGTGDRPGRPGTGDRPGRPGGGDLVDRPGRPGDRPNRPGTGNRPGRPGDDYFQHRPSQRPNYDRWNNIHHNHWTNINNHWHNHWGNYGNWYNRNWWNRYPHPYFPYRPGYNYWGWATWGAVTSWFPWGWSQPMYYNYGNNCYYQGDTVYYNNQPIATAAEYAAQAEQIALSVPDTPPPADSWMSLGVFALTADTEEVDEAPTMYLQLSVSKEGIIAGTFQNTATDTVQSVEGMVNKESQRAAWTVVDQTRPLMETGIANLTEDTAPVLIHFEDGSTQQWLLVRLDEPK